MTRLEKQLQKCREGGGVELDLSGLDISDLTPFVTEFPNLQVLDVYSTQVHDLSPLKDSVNLQELYVFSTQVRDLTPLKDLANLKQLHVSSTEVSDLSPLKDLVNLQELYVYSTQVTDFSVLDHLTENGLEIYK